MGSSLRPCEPSARTECTKEGSIPIRLRVRKSSVSIHHRACLPPRTGVILNVTCSPQAS